MRISDPGNKEGFSIVEASVSLFVAGVLLLAVISFVRTTSKYTQKLVNRVDSYIQYLVLRQANIGRFILAKILLDRILLVILCCQKVRYLQTMQFLLYAR